jgi:pyroglutamyl-peptidase
MTSVLLTAFEPYDRFPDNSSWLCVQHLTRDYPTQLQLTTRRYPVDFVQARERLARDLQANYDVVLHLGQAPRSSRMQLEQFALNVAGRPGELPDEFLPLTADGPPAYRSPLPLSRWSRQLREAGIPAQVSHHAGTYLCNALLYLSHYLAETGGLRTQAAFVHLPLVPAQILNEPADQPSMPAEMTAAGIRLILNDIARGDFLA